MTTLLVVFMLGVSVGRALSSERTGEPAPTVPAASPSPMSIVPPATPTAASVAAALPAATPTPVSTQTAPTPAPTAPAVKETPAPPPAGQIQPVPILMYHYIRPDPGASDPIGQDLSVTPEAFSAQMTWLSEAGYTPITLGDLAAVRAHQLALPAKPVVLTFDDGYRDFYEHAWPVLERHGFKATTFIITSVVDQPPYMTWDMLATLDHSGLIEVASHTVTHRELPGLAPEDVLQELTQSRQVLEAFLGHAVTAVSYPVGRVNDTVVAEAREAGYDIAVTTRGGYATGDDDALLLPRVRVHGSTTLAQFQGALE